MAQLNILVTDTHAASCPTRGFISLLPQTGNSFDMYEAKKNWARFVGSGD